MCLHRWLDTDRYLSSLSKLASYQPNPIWKLCISVNTALRELIRLQVHHHFNLVQMGLLPSAMRMGPFFPQVHISADSSVHFSHVLSQSQELIQLKTRPTATTRADLHLATSDRTGTSEQSGMRSQRWGRQADPLAGAHIDGKLKWLLNHCLCLAERQILGSPSTVSP